MAKKPKLLSDLFHDTLKDVYFAENRILKTLPKMAKAAQSKDLKAAFVKHEKETRGQVKRLQQVFKILGKPVRAKTCDAIMGITKEGAEIMTDYKGMPALDAGLLAVARTVAGAARLAVCTPDKKCLTQQPRVVVGGNGVSGQAFVDNAAFRDYARSAFTAEVLDMESAAVAHVAYSNHIAFIAFRSLSDLAGGGPGQNEEATFEQLASGNSATVVKSFLRALP